MIQENSILAIIAAAGIGQRFDDDLPKQYFKINGKFNGKKRKISTI